MKADLQNNPPPFPLSPDICWEARYKEGEEEVVLKINTGYQYTHDDIREIVSAMRFRLEVWARGKLKSELPFLHKKRSSDTKL